MDYHDIDMKGPFIGQRISGLPTWSNAYIGREVYNTLTGKKWYGGATGWVLYKDGKMMVSSTDTTPGYLEDKIIAGDDIEITKSNEGANELLNICNQTAVSISLTPLLFGITIIIPVKKKKANTIKSVTSAPIPFA